MGPKADALRAMREANYDKRIARSNKLTPVARLRDLDRLVQEAEAKVAAKPKRKPKPFIPIDDTMIVPTGALGKPKRKARRRK